MGRLYPCQGAGKGGQDMKATKGNMKDQILTTDRRILYCPGCGGEWSGNAGDYWDYPDSHIFGCGDCGIELDLVNKRVTIDYCD